MPCKLQLFCAYMGYLKQLFWRLMVPVQDAALQGKVPVCRQQEETRQRAQLSNAQGVPFCLQTMISSGPSLLIRLVITNSRGVYSAVAENRPVPVLLIHVILY